jgi:hypothetical protein
MQNDLCVNYGKHIIRFAERFDKFYSDKSESDLKYELEKAKLEDENNEKLEQLGEQLDKNKNLLRRATHHQDLDKYLTECFASVDIIDQEFRDFHERNKGVISKHLPFINEVFGVLEDDLCGLMEMKPLTFKTELEDRNDKIAKYKAKLKTDNFIKERDEREARELEDLLEKNKDNKKFKPPKAKVTDAKKQAQEWQELFNKFYSELKRPVVQIDDSGSGNPRLVARSLKACVTSLFENIPAEETEEEKAQKEKAKKEQEELQRKLREEEEAKKKKGGKPAKTQSEEQVIEVIVDPEDAEIPAIQHHMPVYENGHNLFGSDFLFHFEEMLKLVEEFRQNVFESFRKRKQDCVSLAEDDDREFIELSLVLLDERLKTYYSMKGKIQTEIYSIRSGEITLHKKKYEEEVKECLDEIDSQTSRFNAVYKKLFEDKEAHSKKMGDFRESLRLQNALANLQGVLNNAKEKDFKFGESIGVQVEKLNLLAEKELEWLLQRNEDNIRKKKLIEEQGEYSQVEIEWYRELLKDITAKIEDHKKKRKEIVGKIKELAVQRKEEAMKKFNEAYEVAIDELCAKNATGKVFGKTKRVGQEIARQETTQCAMVDQKLNLLLQEFKDLIAQFNSGMSESAIASLSLSLRERFMALRSACFFYGRYLTCFVDKCPLEEMARVTYFEDSFEVKIRDGEVPNL